MATTRYTLTDSNIWVRAISDSIEMTDPLQCVMPKLLGFSLANVNRFNLTGWPGTKVEWITDSELPKKTTVAEAVDTSETEIDVATGTGVYFYAGDIAVINNVELVYVTSISTDTLTVVRGYGSTSGTAADSGSDIEIVYRVNNEGGSFPLVYTTTTSQPYNYTQIMRYRLTVSGSMAAISQYGIDDEMMYQMNKLWNDGGGAGRAAKDLEDTFFWGERIQRASTTQGATVGSMGGFRTFVSTNTDTAGGDLTKPRLHSMLRNIADEGGTVEYIMGNSYQIEKIINFYDGYRVETQDSKLGGYTLTSIVTPFMPPVKLLNNYRTPAGHLYLFNPSDMGWIPMGPSREFHVRDLPNADDVAADKGLVGEYTFLLKNERFQGYFTGLSTS
jgi:hypothetical protein